jgi:hypothetical protein
MGDIESMSHARKGHCGHSIEILTPARATSLSTGSRLARLRSCFSLGFFFAAANDLGAIWFRFILLWYDELSALALRSRARPIIC